MFDPIVDFSHTPRSWSKLFDGDLRQISLPVPDKDWVWTNPSILRHPNFDDLYLCAVRLTTAPWLGSGTSVVTIVKTNRLGIPTSAVQLNPPANDRIKIPNTPVVHYGAHDARLFLVNNKMFMTATVWDDTEECVQSNGETFARIALLEVSDDFKWTKTVMLPSAIGDVEKNWMPINGELSWLYLPSQNIFGEYSIDSGKFKFSVVGRTSPELEFARGGSQLIDIGDSHLLGVVHVVALSRETKITFMNRLRYTHQFVMYDKHTKNLLALSPYFYFIGRDEIEFAAGLTLSHSNDKLIVSFGHRDSTAWLAEASLETVLANMRAVPQHD